VLIFLIFVLIILLAVQRENHLKEQNYQLRELLKSYLEGHLRCVNNGSNTILIGKDSITVDCKRRK
jgi:hypothetical protein